MNQIIFSEDQQVAFDYLTGDKLDNFILLEGAAGTGKTTLVVHVLRHWLFNPFGKVTMTALTHKAVAVIREMLSEADIFCEVNTIHSALGLRVVEDKTNGTTSLEQAVEPKVPHSSILTVDEASMADHRVWHFIKQTQKTHNLTVLLIADRNQIPPVNNVDDELQEQLSPVFYEDEIHRLVLTQTIRQHGASPIVDLARHFIESPTMPRMGEAIENEHGRVELASHAQLVERAKTLVQEAHTNQDHKHCIVLAHKNTAVVSYNNLLRKEVWGDVEPYRPGEHLIANEQCNGRNAVGGKCEIANNERVVVNSSRRDEKYGLMGYYIILEDGRELFAAEDVSQLIQRKKHYANSKEWAKYFGLKKEVADLRPPHAVTVHKSQSSTYRHVLIDMGDIHSGNNPTMLKKLCYTAITRASTSVMLAGCEAFWAAPTPVIFGEGYRNREDYA